MSGVELKASVQDGLVAAVLRGDLDVTGAADAEAAIAAPVAAGQRRPWRVPCAAG